MLLTRTGLRLAGRPAAGSQSWKVIQIEAAVVDRRGIDDRVVADQELTEA